MFSFIAEVRLFYTVIFFTGIASYMLKSRNNPDTCAREAIISKYTCRISVHMQITSMLNLFHCCFAYRVEPRCPFDQTQISKEAVSKIELHISLALEKRYSDQSTEQCIFLEAE